MRALQIVSYGEIKDSLVFNELSKPAVQSNDVLIEVKAAAINPIDKSIILGNPGLEGTGKYMGITVC